MWQWSEYGSTKESGWSTMKVNGAKGVWFDHCSFSIGYDGLCDSENGAGGLTYSWCTFGDKTDYEPAQDALAILKDAANLKELDERGRSAADLDKSGAIDAKDALEVLKIAANIK